MRSFIFIGFIIAVFLAGVLFAKTSNSILFTNGKSLFWSEDYSFAEDHEQEVSLDGIPDEHNGFFLQGVASKLEDITNSIFNSMIHILYEFSRMFYTNIV